MPSFPVPAFAAVFIIFIWLFSVIRGKPSWIMQSFTLLCALQSLLVALRLHYQLHWLQNIIPITATLIPMLCFLTFEDSVRRRFILSRYYLHLLVPLISLLLIMYEPSLLDIYIPLIFIAYGITILWRLRFGSDALIFNRIEGIYISIQGWKILACLLFLSALSDILIAIDSAGGELGIGEYSVWIVSIFSSLNLLLLAFLLVLRQNDVDSHAKVRQSEPSQTQKHNYDESEVINNLQALMQNEALYLDPDLTLNRLSRRLTVPVKVLSAAVNNTQNQNVSQFINHYRIKEACRLLSEGKLNITLVMENSGFRTKSNFNREFKRMTKLSPSEWKRRQV